MRVVVFGAGYAGLTVGRRLERTLPDEVELVVVDESPTHLVQHELHRIIRNPSIASTITIPLDEVLTDADVRIAHVDELDYEAAVATLDTGDGTAELSYDFGAVCLGAETSYYGLPGVEEHAIPLKRVADAKRIRESATESDAQVLVGGGGLSGVQAAGELAALATAEELAYDVTLVEREKQLAPGFADSFSEALRRELELRGVTVETGKEVTSATEKRVEFAAGASISYGTFVWAGGICGPDAMGGTRLHATADLRVSPSTFVVGDAGAVTDSAGASVPATAQTAVREARVVARNINTLVRENSDTADEPVAEGTADQHSEDDSHLGTYEYNSLGWVVSVGDGAVARIGPLVVNGEPARELKAAIGAGHLGSVGAIDRAADLVASELGWPTSEAVDLANLATSPWDDVVPVPTDPGSPGQLQAPFVGSTFGLFEAFGPDEPVDVTWLTGLTEGQSSEDTISLEELLSAPFDFLSGIEAEKGTNDEP